MVSNFARHVLRNHRWETDVLAIASQPATSKERKKLLRSLRNKGNFIYNQTTAEKKVMRKNIHGGRYVPCHFCLGYFSSKQLYRHKKNCPMKAGSRYAKENPSFQKRDIDIRLKKYVFPHMREDTVAITAQRDPVICAYALRELKCHGKKNRIHIISRKMRELAKLLIEMKKLNNRITNLMDCLKPGEYKNIVQSVKTITKYNEDTDTFESCALAINFAKTLKDCCMIVISLALQKKIHGTIASANLEANVKTLMHLIESKWKEDISSQASDNLNSKKIKKITFIPLASNLKVLKEYPGKLREVAVIKLESKND